MSAPAMNDGGPAFPVLDQRRIGDICRTDSTPGMSLLDWFAGHAMASLIVAAANGGGQHAYADLAASAYGAAAAMLAEREKRGKSE